MDKTAHKQIKFSKKIVDLLSNLNNINKLKSLPIGILICISSYEIVKINLQIAFKDFSGETRLYDNLWTISTIFGATFIGFLSDSVSHFQRYPRNACL